MHVLTKLRIFVYEKGMRPKPGTFLYSKPLDAALMCRSREAELARKVALYNRMQYCVVCGGRLQKYAADIKECPRACGRLHPDRDLEGLAVIVFELSDEGV